MRIYTNTFDIARICPRRFWVSPYSDFKIGVKIAEKGAPSAKSFVVKAGLTELTPDEDKVDGFTTYTLKSADTGFVEYTIEVEGLSEKLKLVQITTDSTVFEVGGGGDVPADVATQSWVNSQISDFVEEDELTAYATKDELTAYAETADLTAYAEKTDLTAYAEKTDLTAYYTKSETSSAAELSDAFANVGGGAISAFDMSEDPVMSKTMVENALKTNTPLPQTIAQYSNGSISVINAVGNLDFSNYKNNCTKVIIGTNVTGRISGFDSQSSKLTAVVIPSTVSETGSNSFLYVLSANFIIPDSITTIRGYSFTIGQDKYIDFGNTRTNVPQWYNECVGGQGKVYVPDNLYNSWISANGWSSISSRIHRHSELEAPYATATAETAFARADSAYNLADGAAQQLGSKVEHIAGGMAPEVMNIATYYESEYAQLSVDDPTWEPDPSTMYVILPDQV